MTALLWLAFILLGQSPVASQSDYASIEGSVVRAGTSERVPNLVIVARGPGKNGSVDVRAQTDENGNFYFRFVPPGEYEFLSADPAYSMAKPAGRHLYTGSPESL